jgi:ketosteroid isomerase-like protein
MQQQLYKTIEEVFDAHLTLIGTNVEAWADLLGEEAVAEFPYATALGLPPRIAGKSAIYNYVKGAINQMQNLTFTKISKYPTLDPNILWAEVHGTALVTPTGRDYQQDYVMRIQIADGKIVHYREYSNPAPAMAAWGNTPNFSDR